MAKVDMDSKDPNYEIISKFFEKQSNNEIKKSAIEKINKLDIIKFHYQIADRQRKCYKKNLTDLKLFDHSIVIEMDFKQKILIGLSPRQVSGEFYRQQQRNMLGNKKNLKNKFYSFFFYRIWNILQK